MRYMRQISPRMYQRPKLGRPRSACCMRHSSRGQFLCRRSSPLCGFMLALQVELPCEERVGASGRSSRAAARALADALALIHMLVMRIAHRNDSRPVMTAMPDVSDFKGAAIKAHERGGA